MSTKFEQAVSGDSDEAMANLYERLMLYGDEPTSAAVEQLQAAYRRVHLRGLDPLRNSRSE